MYDGLGRLVRTQTPTVPGGSNLRTERYYYDGLRRIQELVTLPVTTLGGASGDPVLENLASQSVSPGTDPDQQSAPAPYEEGQLALSGGGGSGGTINREYVWGPGDNGFDELLVQYDKFGNEAWALQDAGGDLVAMCDLNGEDGQGNGGYARVVGQWTFDAYGEVLTAEYLESFAYPHLGHKGLFLARLDATPTSPRLVPYAHSLYHMRNRTYAPGLGRFLQRDPNETAIALVSAMANHGRALSALSLVFDLSGLYGDGGNLYEYLGSNPWVRSDVLGLSYDPFEMVDEYLAETAGQKAAFLSQIGMGAKAIAVVAATVASYLPCPIISGLGDLALYALGEQSGSELALSLVLGMVPGGKLLKPLGGFLARIGKAAFDAAADLASRFGRTRLGGYVLDLSQRAKSWVERKIDRLLGRRGCGCFAASTLVLTPAGAIAISELDPDDIVYTAQIAQEPSWIAPGQVLERSVITEASVLEVLVNWDADELGVIQTTDEHPFYLRELNTWRRADELAIGDHLYAIAGTCVVRGLRFTGTRLPVYNLAVDGGGTYFVSPAGILVHNCVGKLKGVHLENYVNESMFGGLGKRGWYTTPSGRQTFEVDLMIDGGPWVQVTGAYHLGDKVEQVLRTKKDMDLMRVGKPLYFVYNANTANARAIQDASARLTAAGVIVVPAK